MSLRLSTVRRSTIRVLQQARTRRHRRLWVLEGLEDRVLLSGNPTIYTVTDTTDNVTDTGSLRYAITQTNADTNAAGSVIEFDIPTGDPGYDATTGSWTITLSSTLVLSESAGPEVIQGPGANILTISGNNAVGVFQVDSGTTATLSGMTITGGSAASGGGIYNQGSLSVSGSAIENNVAASGGGIGNSGTLTVTDSTISGNAGGFAGGGIDNSGTLTLTNSTVAANGPDGGPIEDGGIDNFGALTTVNATIAYNNAAGLYEEAGATATLQNTIVALNTNQNYYSPIISTVVTYDDVLGAPLSSASAYDLIGLGGSGGLVSGSDGNLLGVANLGLAPELGSNGGPTQTLALLPGSPAIDAGSVALANDYSLTTDQRGFARIVSGTVDIGAFESPVFGNPTVYTVTDTSDNASDTGSLRDCINQANSNTNPAGSVIEFDPTVFSSSSPKTVTLTNTLELCEAPWPEVIQGPGRNALTISGNNSVRVFEVDGNTTATISGLTISDGTDVLDGNGGGGIINNGALTVSDCLISNNSASHSAAIMNNGLLTIGDSTIQGNSTPSIGGGIFNVNLLTVTDCTVADNYAKGQGGGIVNEYLATISDSTLEDNSAGADGGAVFSIGTLRIINSTIDGNCAGSRFSSGPGGGGVAQSSGSMAVTDCTVADNYAKGQGGGIYCFGGSLTISNSTIAENSTGLGPLSANGPPGGGLYDLSEIPGNGPPGVLANSIVVNNTDASGADDIAGPGLSPSSAFNLVGVDETGSLTTANHNQLNVTVPLLGPLADNGGPTETMALLPGSPAIGAGSVALAVDANGNPLSTDQRGEARIVDGNVDIGAFEGQQESTTTTAAASPATSVSGQSVTFTATVTPQAGSAIPIAAGSIQFEVDGSNFGSPVSLVDGSATSAAINSLSVASHTISAVYTSNSADFVASTGSTSLTVEAPTEGNIQSVVNNAPSSSGGSVTIETTSGTAVNTALQAVDDANPSSPVTVTLDLDGANTAPSTAFNAPSSVQVDVTSSSSGATVQGATVTSGTVIVAASVAPVDWTVNGGNVTVEGSASAGDFIVNGGTVTLADGTVITGNSPAVTLNGGTVVLQGVTAQTATNSPTILVNGGSLIVRNSTIEESTGYAEAAILITGGCVDLGTAASPGDNTLNVNGTGELVHNATSSSVPDIGDTLEVNGTPLVSPYLSFTALASSSASSVYGQSVTLTAAVRAANPSDGTPSGEVNFLDTTTGANLGSASVTNGVATLITSALAVGSHTITADYVGNSSFAFSLSTLTQMVQQDNTTTTITSSASTASFGQAVTFTAQIAASAPGAGTPTGTVDFFDTTTNADLTPGGVALSSGSALFSTASLPVGGNTIKVSYSGSGNFLSSNVSTGTITINQSIIVLDPTAGGALSLSGNASIHLTGGVYVDSSSSTALSASGNAQIRASLIDVHGGVQKSGDASLSPTPVTAAASLANPLASLTPPSTTGLTNYGSKSLSGNSSATICPGIYSQISVSGNASLTLNSGIYIIEGGGLSVSGNASISGSGVMIVIAGSTYPTTGGTYGGITLSGNGSYTLSPPTTGTYAGIVIFQPRDNSKALTISGNASGMTGTVYAPAAQLAESGNATLNAALIVDTLTISGNSVANTVSLNTPTGTVAYTPNQIRDAYSINSLSLDGTGQTIAIVDAYDAPSIFQALDAFDAQFTLADSGPTLYAQYGPAASFLTVLNQYGQATSLPSTDPNGPGTDNWEVEEALDVEWTHAIAPGAQIILVEANSQSLSDLMASVASAAGQPGVSVVSMSWGFPEGQAVFASDEATYDSVFNVPGVTFVASTGDYGAADPEYPAFSPNVVAVGGTSLTLNPDNSYNGETGWGYQSDSVGAFIGSGGGTSLYEPEPAYQQGVQSTAYRTTPDVSLVADPATGAWIADTYNLDPSNPFEIVGGTSLSAPAWAGLLALVNQGRAAAGESTLNSSTPTDTQQALYMLPQSDYNAIASGTNGYSAGAGYNLVTGLGTPVANLLVPDLIAYQGSGTTYSGPTVGPLQNATLTSTGTNSSSPIDVFSVFDSLTVTSSGFGYAQNFGRPGNSSAPKSGTMSTSGADATTMTMTSRYRVTASAINPVAAGSAFVTPGGAVGIGMMPLDPTMTAHDSALINWASSPAAAATTETLRGGTDPGPGVSGRGVLVLGGSRTPVLQAALVDSVLEELGALLSRDATNPPGNQPNVKGKTV
jgi:Bacterial Ig-like domain (group 3)